MFRKILKSLSGPVSCSSDSTEGNRVTGDCCFNVVQPFEILFLFLCNEQDFIGLFLRAHTKSFISACFGNGPLDISNIDTFIQYPAP